MPISQKYPTIRPNMLLNFANSKVLDPRITFTRASTATYYGTRTAKAEENFLTYSQEFDNAYWFKGFVTIDANSTIAPDGTLTADRVTEQATSSVHYINTVSNSIASYVSGTAYTYSLYAKKGTGATAPNIIQLSLASGPFASPQYANFDISVSGATSGTVTASSNGTASITTIGSGWYRCSWTATATSNSLANSNGIFFCNNNPTSGRLPNYAGAITSDVFIWGAQLEARSAVSAYTPTTTQPITNYIPVLETAASGVARFDHNPTTFESLGLLIEEQRVNLLTYSADITDSVWLMLGGSGGSKQANVVVAPDGTLSADKFTIGTGSGAWYIAHYGSQPIVSGQAYTFSVYIKAAGSNFVFIRPHNNNGNFGASGFIVNLTNGTITYPVSPQAPASTGLVVNVGNGWWRITATSTANLTTSTTGGPAVWPCNTATFTNDGGSGIPTYTGDGYSGVYIWGAQLEAGACATSYIPTVASQVTRSEETASIQNITSFFNAVEGTLFFETGTSIPVTGQVTYPAVGFTPANLSSSRTIEVFVANQGSGFVYLVRTVSGDVVGLSSDASERLTPAKLSFAYKANDFAYVVDNTSLLSDTAGDLPTAGEVTALNIGSFNAAGRFNGTIKKISYYDQRLPNANLPVLTA